MKISYFFRDAQSYEDFIKNYQVSREEYKNEPLFTVEILKIKTKIEVPDFILMTSKHALEFLLQNSQEYLYQTPVILVGEKLKALCFQKNIKNIRFCGKNIAEVINFLETEDFCNKIVLYPRGQFITVDVKKTLANVNIIEILAYNTHYVQKFSKKFISDLICNKIEFLIFFSLKNLETFISICINYFLTEYLHKICVMSMTDKKIEKFNRYFAKIVIINNALDIFSKKQCS